MFTNQSDWLFFSIFLMSKVLRGKLSGGLMMFFATFGVIGAAIIRVFISYRLVQS